MKNCIDCDKKISPKATRCIGCNNKIQRDYTQINEKRKKTMLTLYGSENSMYIDSFKNKLKNTNLEKYGCENCFQSEEIKEKIKKTNLKNLGVEYPSQSEEVRKKCIETLMNNYGVDAPLKSKEIYQEMLIKNVEKWGVEHPNQLDEVKEKILKTRGDKRIYDQTIFHEYKALVNKLTYSTKKILFNEWDGFDYYDGEYIKENLFIDSNSPLYPTVDHKKSILFCFINNIPAEQSASLDNLCITKRSLNSKKNRKSEEEFKSFL